MPSFDANSIAQLSITPTSTNAVITLQRSQFSDDAGTILYLAIIVSSENVTGGNSGSWDGDEWPELVFLMLYDIVGVTYYQATPVHWWPFTGNLSDFF